MANRGEGKNRERKRRRRRGRRRGRREIRYVFVFELCVIWIPRVLVWRLVVPPFSKVLWRDHINPRFIEVMWVKP